MEEEAGKSEEPIVVAKVVAVVVVAVVVAAAAWTFSSSRTVLEAGLHAGFGDRAFLLRTAVGVASCWWNCFFLVGFLLGSLVFDFFPFLDLVVVAGFRGGVFNWSRVLMRALISGVFKTCCTTSGAAFSTR